MTTRPYQPDGCETLTYRAPDGAEIEMRMLAGATGRLMAPANLVSVNYPQGDGAKFLAAAYLPRAVTVPVVFPGTLADRAELRRWAGVLDPKAGPGVLEVVGGPNPGRVLSCSYEAGLDELEENSGELNVGHLLFRAWWPYWQDGAESNVAISQGGGLALWFPFLPLILGASNAFATFTVNNQGDGQAWPVVTVTGPGQEVIVTNNTTGKSWHLTGTLADTDTAVIDHRPGYKGAAINGVNAFGRLTPDSVLWGLEPGPNQVTVAMTSTTAASLIQVAWRQNWLAA